MARSHTSAEIVAFTLLGRYGVSAIWGLHLPAAGAYRDGHKFVAAGIIEIAEAAEREWVGRGQARVPNGWPHWRA